MPSDDVVYLKDFADPTELNESERAFETVLAKYEFTSQLKLLQAATGIGDYGYSIGLQSNSASSEWLAFYRYCLLSYRSLFLESASYFVEVECRKTPAINATAPPNWKKTDDHTWIYSPALDVDIIVHLIPRDGLW